MHHGHLVHVNSHDRPYITAELLTKFGLARSAGGWREYLDKLVAAGVMRIAYQPAGRDIPRELETFIKAASE